MPNVAIPEGLWRWAEATGRQRQFVKRPEAVIVEALKAARQAAIMGRGLSPALQLLEPYASRHGGRVDMRGFTAESGHMANIVAPVLSDVVDLGFMEPDPESPGDYLWLG